jgi:hypothetical protein
VKFNTKHSFKRIKTSFQSTQKNIVNTPKEVLKLFKNIQSKRSLKILQKISFQKSLRSCQNYSERFNQNHQKEVLKVIQIDSFKRIK